MNDQQLIYAKSHRSTHFFLDFLGDKRNVVNWTCFTYVKNFGQYFWLIFSTKMNGVLTNSEPLPMVFWATSGSLVRGWRPLEWLYVINLDIWVEGVIHVNNFNELTYLFEGGIIRLSNTTITKWNEALQLRVTWDAYKYCKKWVCTGGIQELLLQYLMCQHSTVLSTYSK